LAGDIVLEVLQDSYNLLGAGGGGGKGGGGGSIDEQPNTLRSRSILNILYLLSEGEIAGFPVGQDPRKFIYLDDTPIMSSDGTVNFKGVSLEFRTGTPTQSVILGSGGFGVANFVAVEQKVAVSTGPVVRLVNSIGAAAIRVSLFTPGLRSNSNNTIAGSSVRFKIEISSNGGPWVERVRDRFEGKTSGGYARDYTVKVTATGPWQVRVTRLDPDSTSDQISNDLVWQSYTALFAEQYTYPNSALLYMRFDSAYIKSTPKISLKLGGMICWVPSNYNATTRTYTGIWNGLFARALTDNPAWLLYTSILAERWGTGNRIKPEHIDKWSFYRFGQRCDEMISDGWGGVEPRHTFRQYIRNREDALPGLQNLLTEARAQIYWDGGQIFLVQDRPGVVLADTFTNANVATKYQGGKMAEPPFKYAWTAAQAIHTVALISFYDQNNFGRKDIVRVDSTDIGYANDLIIYGDVPIEVTLPGTTTRAAAVRHGRWRLITERLEDKVISFAAGSAGQLRRPGELLAIQDNGCNAKFLGGRVLAATVNSVRLDRQISWAIGDQFMLDTPALITVVATNTGVESDLLQFATLSSVPPVGSVWIVFSRVAPTLCRVLSIADREDNTFAIQGIQHAPEKYAIADGIGNFSASNYGESMLPVPKPPSKLEIRPTTATAAGYTPNAIANTYEIGWAPSPDASVQQYILQKSTNATNYWESIPVPPTYTDVKVVVDASQYLFRVAAVGGSGKVSEWVYGTYGGNFQGTIVGYLPEGALKLSRSVLLEVGKTYEFEAAIGGQTYRQSVVTPAGITDEILTTPGWIGATQTLSAVGSTTDIEYATLGVLYAAVSYIVVTNGIAKFYQGENFLGTETILTDGVYRADYGQIPNDYFASAKLSPGTKAFISQNETGYNPPPGSIWRLIQL
jgi:predicted phage tail protein